MKKSLISAGVAMLCLAGCSVNQSIPSGGLQEVVTAKHTAHVQVGPKISAKSSVHVLFGFIKLGGDNKYIDSVDYAGGKSHYIPFLDGDMEELKSAAAYKAVTYSGADVLVAPTYKTAVKYNILVYKKLEAVVEGYKGTITGFTQTY